MIKVYSTNSCPWCVKAKNYLKSQNIDFEDLNVQEDMVAREEMINKSHQMSVPVYLVRAIDILSIYLLLYFILFI